jgi:hypothetical protein
LLDSVPPYTAPDVRGVWFYGPPGTGKTHAARTRYPGAYIKAQNKWWDGYQKQRFVVLDDLDQSCLNHYLKIWADKWPCTGESKGGTLNLHHRAFIVTSNYEPEDLVRGDQAMCQAIRRRFKFEHFAEVYRRQVDPADDQEVEEPLDLEDMVAALADDPAQGNQGQ